MEKRLDPVQLLIVLVSVAALVIIAWLPGEGMAKLKLTIGYVLLLLIFLFGMTIVVSIVRGKIQLDELIEELDGGASMSRFQLLIFTFVIGLSFFYLTVTSTTNEFPKVPAEVLTLLGLSASTYAVSKAIQVSGGLTQKKEDQRADEAAAEDQ